MSDARDESPFPDPLPFTPDDTEQVLEHVRQFGVDLERDRVMSDVELASVLLTQEEIDRVFEMRVDRLWSIAEANAEAIPHERQPANVARRILDYDIALHRMKAVQDLASTATHQAVDEKLRAKYGEAVQDD